MINGFDFTISIVPKNINLNVEKSYIKSALLYADNISLISPTAYILCQIMEDSTKTDDRSLVRLIQKIMPYCEAADPTLVAEISPDIDQFSRIVFSKKYRSAPVLQKIEINKVLRKFANSVSDVIIKNVGSDTYNEIVKLRDLGKIKIQSFENSMNNSDECVKEYFEKLKSSITMSYPLFDELSCSLMRAAMSSGIIELNPTSQFRTTHAGLADNIINRLPSFEFASVDEILDIRKELEDSLIRFRSKLLKYTDEIHSVPWQEDFISECQILYDKEIAPSILDINELCSEASFLKNLGENVFRDKNILRSAGGIFIGIAASCVRRVRATGNYRNCLSQTCRI